MGGYRDDREALLSRVAVLERALAEAAEGPSRAELAAQLAELADQVARTTAEVDDDRRALGDLARSLERMRRSIDGTPAKEAAAAPAAGPGTRSEAERRGRRSFLVGGVAVVALVVGAWVWLAERDKYEEEPHPVSGGFPDPGVSGFPHAVDPVALHAEAGSLVPPHASFGGLRVEHVGPSGLVDLDAPRYRARIRYHYFRRKATAPPDESVPLGARTAAPAALLEDEWTVRLDADGWAVEGDSFALAPFGATEALPAPRCSLKAVWDAARAAGAPSENVVATIEYRSFLDGPEWAFEIPGTSTRLRILDDGTCAGVIP